MGQTGLLLKVLFCFGHKQSCMPTGSILSPDFAFTPDMNHRVEGLSRLCLFLSWKIYSHTLTSLNVTENWFITPQPTHPPPLPLCWFWCDSVSTGTAGHRSDLSTPLHSSTPPSSIRRSLTDIYLSRYGPCGDEKAAFRASFCTEIQNLSVQLWSLNQQKGQL